MTLLIPNPPQVQKVVLFFDICSSTVILEDLLRTENVKLWRNLLLNLRDYLNKRRTDDGFEIYKFMGDGWVLLFNADTRAEVIFELMKGLSNRYAQLHTSTIRNVLTIEIANLGIAFGIDRGTLVKVVMNNRFEYIGQPLNVAARLQSAISDNDSKPAGKVLISNNAFVGMRPELQGEYRIENASRSLRNIAGGRKYLCKKVTLFP